MDIVEAFVASIGWDSRDYERGQKRVRDDDKRTRDQLGESSKRMDEGTRRQTQGIRTLRNEAIGLFLTFAGASSLKSFISDMILGDAATGRLAGNLGIATSKLNAWQEAAKTVGGNAGTIGGTLTGLAQMYQNAQIRGDYSKRWDLAALGMDYRDLADPTEALLKLSAASERMSKTEFTNRAGALGIDPATINLLEQGRTGLEKLLREEEKHAKLTQADADAAAELQKKLAELATTIKGETRPALYGLIDYLTKSGDAGKFLNGVIEVLTGSLRGLSALASGDIFRAAALRADIYYSGLRARVAPNPQMKQYWLDRASADADELSKIATRNDERYGRGASGGGGAKGGYSDSFKRSMGAPSQGALDRIAPSGAGGLSESAVMSRLTGAGFTPEQARGITAGIHAESGLNARNVNPTSGAYGLGQWLGPRKKALMAKYGPNPTADQQLEFLIWELKGGDAGGAAVGKQTSADHALLAYIVKFMRPAGGGETTGDIRRGRAFLAGRSGQTAAGAPVTQTTTIGQIVINSATDTPDAHGAALRKNLKDRGIVTQANTGLTG